MFLDQMIWLFYLVELPLLAHGLDDDVRLESLLEEGLVNVPGGRPELLLLGRGEHAVHVLLFLLGRLLPTFLGPREPAVGGRAGAEGVIPEKDTLKNFFATNIFLYL